jgi:hypothetical protein
VDKIKNKDDTSITTTIVEDDNANDNVLFEGK